VRTSDDMAQSAAWSTLSVNHKLTRITVKAEYVKATHTTEEA